MPNKNGKGYSVSIGGNVGALAGADEAFNETVASWYELDSDFSKNVVVALDPEFTLTMRFDSDDLAHQAIQNMRYSVSARSQEIIITDPLHGLPTSASGSTITFNGSITSISAPRQTEDVVELDVTIKIESGDVTIAAVV